MKRLLTICLCVLIIAFIGCGTSSEETSSEETSIEKEVSLNIILFIGDGMGFEHVKAAGMYQNGEAGTLSFESFSNTGEVITSGTDEGATDSAAAATAMATGQKVATAVLSMNFPGDGSELETILEYFKQRGKSVGLVTTSIITDATPAAFAAHERQRWSYEAIASDYFTQTLPNILYGGAKYVDVTQAEEAGYTVVTNRDEMEELDTESETMVSGQFGTWIFPVESEGVGSLPHLSEMTRSALNILDNDPDGFFLMVEGALIDSSSHRNNLIDTIFETIEFSNAVEEALDWVSVRDDTLIIVVADHETGGLEVISNNGIGNLPAVNWTAGTDHTESNIPIYAWGVNAEVVDGTMDNTDVYGLMIDAYVTLEGIEK